MTGYNNTDYDINSKAWPLPTKYPAQVTYEEGMKRTLEWLEKEILKK
jgi:hypothetical protein